MTPPPAFRPPDLSADASGEAPFPAFLGRGWSFPPRFDPVRTTVFTAVADRDIRESLWIILSTRPGERVMLPGFGCDLASKLFTVLTTTTAHEIAEMVRQAIIAWEPRVTVIGVAVSDGELDGWIDIAVDYRVDQTNTRSNLVFPFCRAEATLLPPEV